MDGVISRYIVMQILSALEAISPAIARTKLVLYSPFRKGRSWKLAATGYISLASTVFLPLPLIYLGFLPMMRAALGDRVLWLVAGGLLVVTAIFLVCFYLATRLQFCFFDIVLNGCAFIAPAWQKYGRQAGRWTWVKVLLGTGAMLVLALPIAAYVRHILPLLESIKANEAPPPSFIPLLLAGYGIVFAVFTLTFLASAMLSDFVVPSLALEDTTTSEALRRFGGLIRREPAQVAAYFFLKLALGIAGYMAQALAFYAAAFAYVLVLAVIFGIGFLVLHLLHVSTVIMAVLAGVIGFAGYLFVCFYAAFLFIGTVATFLQAYTLYFLGGRYPLLGELLDRSTPVPVFTSPQSTAFAQPDYPPQAQ